MMLLIAWIACIDPSGFGEKPAMTNHVDDWRDEVIYQVMVDRFANGDVNNDYNVAETEDALARYQGGDYRGLIDNVDYLETLGVTTIWVSPIVKNVEVDAGVSSYHGYWTQDFGAVNPHFGDLATFRELVSVMHAHDIKVILDIVTNHVGQLFYYDINRNGQPDTTVYGAGSRDPSDTTDPIEIVTEWDPKYDERGVQAWTSLGESGEAPLGWVYMPEINRLPPEPPEFHDDAWYNRRGRVVDWNNDAQVLYGDFPGGLKDLDTANPDVRDALIRVFEQWIEETDIDGYRIDTVKHVEHGFWQQFCPAMREKCRELGKENFLMFGEVFDGDDALLGSYTAPDELDAVFYFSHKFQVFDDVYKRGGPTSAIEALYADREANYGGEPQAGGVGVAPHDVLVPFLDNHDVPRFLYDQPNEAALKAALVHLLTMDGVPCLYYGTEQGFNGGNDPANREPLWQSELRTDGALFQHVAALTQLRKDYPALRRGDFTIRWASDRVGDEEDAHVVAFERRADEGAALVVISSGGTGRVHTGWQGAAMPVGFAPGTELRAVFPTGSDRRWTVAANGTVDVEVEPFEGLVLVPSGEVVGR